MMHSHKIMRDIRRRPVSSIDFDAYRAAATALRGQARRDAVMVTRLVVGVATALAALVLIVLIAGRMPAPGSSVAAIPFAATIPAARASVR
jgi:hypothetical protein